MIQAHRTSRVTDGCAPSLTELNDYTSNKVKEETDAFEKGNFREGEIRFCAFFSFASKFCRYDDSFLV